MDSISEDVLRNHRAPGFPPPVVIEDFVANALMMRVGLFTDERHHNEDLRNFLIKLRGTSFGFNINEMRKALLEIKVRLYYDPVRWDEFQNEYENPGVKDACLSINDCIHALILYDFIIKS